uniref:Reverse transcriptase domain-containing protein n=1 Tax=Panagrellus redivivus TaxID=6233 RepID=A0A7E4V5K4_PANRE
MTSSSDCAYIARQLWNVRMPQGLKYTCATFTNDMYQGLRRLRLQLSYDTRTLLRRIGQAPNMEVAEIDVQKFYSHLTSEYTTLMEAQRLIQKFLQRLVSSTAAVSITKGDGSTRFEYNLPSGNKRLVIVISDWVDPPLRKSNDKRSAQKIITAFTTR